MNNKQTPGRLNESDLPFWLGLIGSKAYVIGGGLAAILSWAAMKRLWKLFSRAGGKSGNSAGFFAVLRDKQALKKAGFTSDQIKLLWEKDAMLIKDLLKRSQNEMLESVERGVVSPEDALQAWNSCIPKGKGSEFLEQLRSLADAGRRNGKFGRSAAAEPATQSTGAYGRSTIGFTQATKEAEQVTAAINKDQEIIDYFRRLKAGESIDEIERSLKSQTQRNRLKALIATAAVAGGIAALLKYYTISSSADGTKKIVPLPPKPKPTAGGITPAQLKTLTRNQKDAHEEDPMLTYDELINGY
jgi:hypothetical protein